MKKAILLLPAILFIQLVQAQKPDAVVALVRYSFSHIRDTTNKAKVYTENMELLLGKMQAFTAVKISVYMMKI